MNIHSYIYTWPITNNLKLNLKLWRGWKKLLWVKLTTCPRNVTWRELKEKERKKKENFFFSFSARRINKHDAVRLDCRATDCRTTAGRSVTSYCRTATRECTFKPSRPRSAYQLMVSTGNWTIFMFLSRTYVPYSPSDHLTIGILHG